MLNDFRNVDVIWDKATKNFVKKIRVASSDERGRKLTVQVVNGGQVENLTGSTLSLYWITENKEHQGLDGFTQVDATQGIFEIYYTTEMLGNIGKLRANLHLIDEIGAVSSEQFFIEVFLGIDSEAVQSNDSFSALTQALAEVQTIKEDEAERVDAETERITAEEERVSNENERKTAETTRNTNETTRVSNETDRVNAEDTRKANETNRVDAESDRVTAETARVTAEEEREQGYPTLDGRITAVEQKVDLSKIRFYQTSDLKAQYAAMRDGEVRVVYSWNVTVAQGWPLDESTRNACLLIRVNKDYGLAIANSGHIGQWYPSSTEFVWR